MRKLLRANFSRLRRDRIFYIMLLVALVGSFVMIYSVTDSVKEMRSLGYERTLDQFYFGLAPYMGLIDAMFISLFLGTEYSDGTVRNKLVAGHTRISVYLANYFASLAACLAFAAAWLMGGLPGLRLIGPFEFGLAGYLGYLLVIVFITASFTAVFTWIATACHNKAITVVLSMSAWIGMVLVGSALIDLLAAPEMIGGMAYVNGQFVMEEMTPNPRYIQGAQRAVLEFFRDVIPTGPAILMTDASLEDPLRAAVLGGELSLVVTVLGMLSFRRKDLK